MGRDGTAVGMPGADQEVAARGSLEKARDIVTDGEGDGDVDVVLTDGGFGRAPNEVRRGGVGDHWRAAAATPEGRLGAVSACHRGGDLRDSRQKTFALRCVDRPCGAAQLASISDYLGGGPRNGPADGEQ